MGVRDSGNIAYANKNGHASCSLHSGDLVLGNND